MFGSVITLWTRQLLGVFTGSVVDEAQGGVLPFVDRVVVKTC